MTSRIVNRKETISCKVKFLGELMSNKGICFQWKDQEEAGEKATWKDNIWGVRILLFIHCEWCFETRPNALSFPVRTNNWRLKTWSSQAIFQDVLIAHSSPSTAISIVNTSWNEHTFLSWYQKNKKIEVNLCLLIPY